MLLGGLCTFKHGFGDHQSSQCTVLSSILRLVQLTLHPGKWGL